MAKTSAWMPLYIGDYLADTMHLTGAQHGAYLLLIMHYWRSGPLPDDSVALATIARTERGEWSAMALTVRAFFQVSSVGLTHAKLDSLARKFARRPDNPEWQALRTYVFRRDDFTCQYCGVRGGALECDHIVPFSRGGPSHPSNLATACMPCNRAKGALSAQEWAQ